MKYKTGVNAFQAMITTIKSGLPESNKQQTSKSKAGIQTKARLGSDAIKASHRTTDAKQRI